MEEIVASPQRVASNAFFPFLSYEKRYQPFRRPGGGVKPSKKLRPIAYASRRDAAIFEHYRGILAEKYEARLLIEGIQDCPIAYRRIATESGGGKCNIDFARDAFDFISKQKKCRAYVVDISSYFPSISHKNLYKIWCELMGFERMPEDHYAVYKAITRYSYVDREELYKELGFIGPKAVGGGVGVGYLRHWNDIPLQLCSPKKLREILNDRKSSGKKIHYVNKGPAGIPQGAPISDVLANINLLHFDIILSDYVNGKGGFYRRYSDDIIIILPEKEIGSRVLYKLRYELSKCGDDLKIKDSKISIVDFNVDSNECFRWVSGVGKNGLEYLGFRFDGRSVFLRDKTVSNFFRKIAVGARAYVNSTVARYRDLNSSDIAKKIDPDEFFKKYSRVEGFDLADDYRRWTFWTYVRRARKVFGDISKPMDGQLRNFKKVGRERLQYAMSKAGIPTTRI
ncbi:reverse transcriptase domain-containing protein [Maricaulis sp.]|uniref:reverse transcriptase domain-containing protein n=1 Tax=Maricaulis sp. TaxID=1486257 RepID=UPI00329762D2